ncbi:MAG TPA: PH domain-containing protein [Candidatus Limnocylindria bacterium]|nr:PH domain-containing protein [Candidatus Limnocylindria bacterium]
MAKAETEAEEQPEKLFPDQLDGEEVLLLFRKHPIVMRKGLVFGMFGPLVGILPTAIWPTLGFGWFFAGLFGGIGLGMLILFPFWINWYYSVYIVTDRRLIQITQKGLFRKSFVDLGLGQIQSLNYEVNGLQATLLGYGTILVQTYVGDLVIHDVHHPAKLYKQLITILRDEGIEPAQMTPEKQQEVPGLEEENQEAN